MVDPQGTGGVLTAEAPPTAPRPGTPFAAVVSSVRGPRRLLWCALAAMLVAGLIVVRRPSTPQRVISAGPVVDQREGVAGRAAPRAGPDRPSVADAPLDMPLADADSLQQAAARDPVAFDSRLLATYARFAKGDADGAVEAARSLSESTPSSGLAQIVYADLLRLRSGAPPVSGWGASAPSAAEPSASTPSVDAATATARLVPGSEVSHQSRLDELLAEARARLAAVQSTPRRGTLPSQFVQLSPGVRHAIAVDVGRSRAYVLAAGPDGWTVTRDYYASVGKLGSDKHSEGDLRTPLGVYFVTGTVPRGRMADRFGSTALTLNYPNQYDQLRGRTGNGIWLHGVPATLYARAPLATDGCIALSNDDMDDLARQIDRQQTPILVAPSLDWVPAGRIAPDSVAFLAAFADWRAAHETPGPDGELAFYSSTVRTPAAASGPAWGTLLESERRGVRSGWAPTLSDVSMVRWKDDRPLMVVTFWERVGSGAPTHLRRQYWADVDGRWRIIYEGDVG